MAEITVCKVEKSGWVGSYYLSEENIAAGLLAAEIATAMQEGDTDHDYILSFHEMEEEKFTSLPEFSGW